MYDELDLQVANLLQIDPRIPWAHAERILGVSATSLARRWSRLVDDGLAWIATYPNAAGERATAFVNVDCRSGHVPQVIDRLCEERMVISLDECTGEHDILLTVIAPDLQTLTPFVFDEIGGLDGVLGVHSSVMLQMHSDGSAWRLDALDRHQIRAASANVIPPERPRRIDEADIALLEALARDGRASVASLATALDAPASTVHRRLHRLRAGRQLSMRCDVAPELSGWRLEWSWLVNVPPGDRQRIVESLRHRPELRMCASTTGQNNLVFTVRAHTLAGLADFEAWVAASMPALAPSETMIHLRARKRVGWLLDADGRSTGRVVVPVFT